MAVTKFGCNCMDWDYIVRIFNYDYVRCNKCGCFHKAGPRWIKNVTEEEMVGHMQKVMTEKMAKNDVYYVADIQRGFDRLDKIKAE